MTKKVSIGSMTPVPKTTPQPCGGGDVDATELLNFEAILAAFASTTEDLLDVTTKLANVPFPLVDQLARVCTKDSPKGAPQVQALFKMELSAFSKNLTAARPMLEDLQKVLQQQRAHNAEAREIFDRYEHVKEEKERSAKQAEGLEDRISPDGYIPENVRKQIKDKRDSEEELKRCTAAREKMLKNTLRTKWGCLKQVLAKFCTFYATAFKSTEKLVLDFEHLSEELTKDKPTHQDLGNNDKPGHKDKKQKEQKPEEYVPPAPMPMMSTRIINFLRGSTTNLAPPTSSGRPGALEPERREQGVECHIKIVRAKGLRNVRDLTPDAYCTCEVPGKPRSKFQTDVVAHKTDPTWELDLMVPEYDEGDSFVFNVWHQDFGKSSEGEALLGTVLIPSDKFYDSGFRGEVRLTDTGVNAAGKNVKSKLEIEITLTGKKPPEPKVLPEEEEPEPEPRFTKGEEVMVWSGGQQAWLRGTVEVVFLQDTLHEGYAIQAGVIKVVSSAGVKYIKPAELQKVVRKIKQIEI